MTTQCSPAPGSFEAEFQSRLDKIRKRGAAVGLSVSSICESAGVARATPDRWRDKTPLTITLVDKMEAVVAEAEKRAAAGDASTAD